MVVKPIRVVAEVEELKGKMKSIELERSHHYRQL